MPYYVYRVFMHAYRFEQVMTSASAICKNLNASKSIRTTHLFIVKSNKSGFKIQESEKIFSANLESCIPDLF